MRLLIVGIGLFSVVSYAQPVGPTGAWDLAFEDNFNGTTLDTKKWGYNYPWGATHNHRAYMTDTMVKVKDGILTMKAIRKRHPSAPDGTNKWESSFGYIPFDYTSGAVHTNGKFNFTYGYAEARLKIPSTLGTWPAFWTLNANGAWPPEIDILEVPSDRKVHHYYYHYGPDYQNEKSFGATHTGVDKSLDFHTYGVEWGANFMKFYFDGKVVNSYTGRPECAQGLNMYLILNLAVGGWAPAPTSDAVFPAYYACDWVRVWKRNSDNKNLDFETGSLAPWYAWNNANVTKDCGLNGTFGVKNSGNPASIEQVIEVEPNTNYVYGGQARVSTSGDQVLFGVKDYGGNQVSKAITITSFKKDSVVFKTGATNTSATLFWYKDKGAGYACGDDFFFYKAKVVTGLATESDSQIGAYPNPFYQSIVVQAPGIFSYSVWDAFGIQIEAGEAENSKIIGQHFTTGIYTVKIQNGSGTKVIRTIKSN